jgi:hypothetical protein
MLQGTWNETVENFIIDQLERKIDTYDEYRLKYPQLGGMMTWPIY